MKLTNKTILIAIGISLFAVISNADEPKMLGCTCSYSPQYTGNGKFLGTYYKIEGFYMGKENSFVSIDLTRGSLYDGNRNSNYLAERACETALNSLVNSSVCPVTARIDAEKDSSSPEKKDIKGE